MKDGPYPSQNALWKINSRYYTSQGAAFAQLLSMLAGVVDCTPQENDYEFKHGIIFKGDDEKQSDSLFGKIAKAFLQVFRELPPYW